MTVGELIEKLQKYPKDKIICMVSADECTQYEDCIGVDVFDEEQETVNLYAESFVTYLKFLPKSMQGGLLDKIYTEDDL